MAGKRNIFEEVGTGAPAGAGTGIIESGTRRARQAIRIWLILLFLLVTVMIVVGGLTRLTDSGLSITEWRPVTGTMPPMDAAAWAAEFAKYQGTPQFERLNPGMTLQEFKVIYWWEWGHRQLGRLIGLVWAIGFLWFLLRRRIPRGWSGRLLFVGFLGGLQGAIGWWMVASGLEGARITVAPYRLAIHLGLGFIILGVIAWYAMLLGRTEASLLTARRARENGLFILATGLLCLVFVQIILGALVAGTGSGAAFPTWPLMGQSFVPPDLFHVTDLDGKALPAWHAFFEGLGMTQFVHRMVGYLVLLVGLVVWFRARRSTHRQTRFAFSVMMLVLLGQVALGIAAVLTLAPLPVAITHQIGAILLWILLLRARHLAQYPVAGSIRKGTA